MLAGEWCYIAEAIAHHSVRWLKGGLCKAGRFDSDGRTLDSVTVADLGIRILKKSMSTLGKLSSGINPTMLNLMSTLKLGNRLVCCANP